MTSRRYEPLLKIASGGTASVYVGSAVGALGFRQLVAIKRPHAHLADDPAFCATLVAEAKIASQLHHANVVDVRDVEVDDNGIQLVMDYVEGASLSELIRSWTREPPLRPEAVGLRIIIDTCAGLGAVHDLKGDDGAALGLVHRDVSPANVLVGLDGVSRIADFGLAKPLLAVERTTSEGVLRGKLGYMAPEYIRGQAIDRRIDVFAMGVVLWEVLARKRLFRGENDGDTLDRVQQLEPPRLAEIVPHLGKAAVDLDGVIAHALAKDPVQRVATVDALAAALESVVRAHDLGATHGEVREAFMPSLRAALEERRRRVQIALNATQNGDAPVSRPPLPPAPAFPVPLTAPRSEPPAQLPSHTPPAIPQATPASAPRAPASRAVLAAALALAIVSALAITVVMSRRHPDSSAAGAAGATARVVTSDVDPISSEVRGRASPSAALPNDALGDGGEPTTASSRGVHGGARPPVRGPSDEPGKKPPRPNPYASASPAR